MGCVSTLTGDRLSVLLLSLMALRLALVDRNPFRLYLISLTSNKHNPSITSPQNYRYLQCIKLYNLKCVFLEPMESASDDSHDEGAGMDIGPVLQQLPPNPHQLGGMLQGGAAIGGQDGE